MALRLRRSVLFTPGTRPDRVQKALERRSADVVVADLEDAVGPDEKDAAREGLRAVLKRDDGPDGPERWLRVNAWGTPWTVDDLVLAVQVRPDAIVVPKAGAMGAWVALDATLARLERAAGSRPGGLPLVPIIETAAGVGNVERLVANPRVTAVAFGAEDLAADAGLRRSAEATEVLAARSRVGMVCGARDIDAIDQVYVDLEDTEGLEREARFARTLGFRGKMVLHPRQVAPVQAAFSPSEAEVAAARRLVAAIDEAAVGAGGVLRFEGRMIDVPLIRQAKRVLAEAEAATTDQAQARG